MKKTLQAMKANRVFGPEAPGWVVVMWRMGMLFVWDTAEGRENDPKPRHNLKAIGFLSPPRREVTTVFAKRAEAQAVVARIEEARRREEERDASVHARLMVKARKKAAKLLGMGPNSDLVERLARALVAEDEV